MEMLTDFLQAWLPTLLGVAITAAIMSGALRFFGYGFFNTPRASDLKGVEHVTKDEISTAERKLRKSVKGLLPELLFVVFFSLAIGTGNYLMRQTGSFWILMISAGVAGGLGIFIARSLYYRQIARLVNYTSNS